MSFCLLVPLLRFLFLLDFAAGPLSPLCVVAAVDLLGAGFKDSAT
jgi:hypothetical protein